MSRKLPKSHCFNGKRYRILWRKARLAQGSCDSPKTPASNRNIFVNPNGTEKDRINVLIHETIHACVWNLDEDTVKQTADDITNFLYKCGLRFEK